MIVEKLTAVFDLDATGFNAGMKKAQKNLDSVKASADGTSMNVGKLGDVFSSATASITIATVAITAFGTAVIASTIKLAEMVAEIQSLDRGLKFATGSSRQGREAFKFLNEASDRLGVSLEKSSGAFKLMAAAAKGTSLEGEKVKEIYLAIAEASAVVGLSQFQSERVFYAVQQMMSKGVVSAEEFRQQLGEHLPMATKTMAKALGVTTGELNKLMSMGVLMAEDVLPAFAKTLREDLADSVGEAGTSMQAALARLSNAWFLAKREMLSGVTESGLKKTVEGITEIVKALPKYWRMVEHALYLVGKSMKVVYDITKETLSLFINMVKTMVVILNDVATAIFTFLISPFVKAKETLEEWGAQAPNVDIVTDSIKGLGKAVSDLVKLPDANIPLFDKDSKEMISQVDDQAEAVKRLFEDKFSNLRLQLQFERLEAENSAASEFEKAKIVIEKRLQQRVMMLEGEYKARLQVIGDNKLKELALTEKFNELIADVQLTADKQLGAARLEQMKSDQEKINRMFEKNYGAVISFVGNSVKKLTDTLVDLSMGGKKSFKEMVNSIIADMQKLVYQIFVIEPIIKAFRAMLQKAIPSGEGMLGMFSGEGSGGSLIKNLFGMAKNILGFQSGGVINEPVAGIGLRTGSGYTLGEAGPETVTPGTPDGSPITVNINALDSKSLVDLMDSNPNAVLGPLVSALQAGDRGVTSALRGSL